MRPLWLLTVCALASTAGSAASCFGDCPEASPPPTGVYDVINADELQWSAGTITVTEDELTIDYETEGGSVWRARWTIER